jgi:hypothetical protein
VPPLTRAEATKYQETSRHADVIAFVDALASPQLVRTSFGVSPEGRDLPLLVLSRDGVASPEAARRAGRPIVLVINGIHAGEVEGKEASLMLVRDLLAGKHDGLLDRITLLVAPLFNPDGNDRIDPANRALDLAKRHGQLGPDSGVGTRTNAAGINLNRDYLRQETAEMRALHREVMLRWQPDLTIDCHATNGSIHRFDLTYDVPHTIESGRPEPIAFMRDVFTPALRARARERHRRETFFYGNFVVDEGGSGPGWMTYTHHPRFGSNYRGLTGRCDLLFEAYAYLPFPERVATTYSLLLEALYLANERADAIADVVARAATPRDRVAVRYRLEPTDEVARIPTREPAQLDGAPIEVTIPHYARFVPTVVVARPFAYAVPEPVARHLAHHGLAVRQLERAREVEVEPAKVEAVRVTDTRSILEAPGESLITASVERRRERLEAGTWLVDTAHRLGAIAVYLCEPESDDGLVATGLMPLPRAGDRWPALRILEPA